MTIRDNSADKYNLTAAIDRDDLAAVKEIMARGADPNIMLFNPGITPLRRAAANFKWDIMDYLLSLGVDVTPACGRNWTAMDVALPGLKAEWDQTAEVLAKMVIAGAPLNRRKVNGMYPLYFALTRGNMRMAGFMIDHGAAIDGQAEGQRHAIFDFMDAAKAAPTEEGVFTTFRCDVIEAVGFLLTRGLDPATRAPDGRRMMDYARDIGLHDLAIFLKTEQDKNLANLAIAVKSGTGKVLHPNRLRIRPPRSN